MKSGSFTAAAQLWEEHARLARKAARLRVHAAIAKQIGARVELNQKIEAIELAMDHRKKLMLGDGR